MARWQLEQAYRFRYMVRNDDRARATEGLSAIVERERARSGVTYDPGDVIVTPGGKFALLTALMAVAQDGDEVLVPEPGWVSYGPCVKLAGGTPVGISMLALAVRSFQKTE